MKHDALNQQQQDFVCEYVFSTSYSYLEFGYLRFVRGRENTDLSNT